MKSKNTPDNNSPELRNSPKEHPSRNLEPRARGYGIGGGYEKPLRQGPKPTDDHNESYGPLPHSGYYGSGAGKERFERGKAGYNEEISWYIPQYGEKTS
ncbi:MAG: hypothetical protein WAV47_15535 [Blastocatellia bacterium]